MAGRVRRGLQLAAFAALFACGGDREAPQSSESPATTPSNQPTTDAAPSTTPVRPPLTSPTTPPTTAPTTAPTTPPTRPDSSDTPPTSTSASPPAETTTPIAEDGRCLDCVGVPPAGIAAQLGAFTGGGAGPECSLAIEEILGLSASDPFAGPWTTELSLGTNAWFCVSGFDPAAPIDIVIQFPDGSERSIVWSLTGDRGILDVLGADGPVEVSAGGDAVWPLRPGYPLGRYLINAQQNALVGEWVFDLVASNDPSFEPVPPQRYFGETVSTATHDPGSEVEFLLSGFSPNSAVTPLLYRRFEDERCGDDWCFITTLPDVLVDDVGVAAFMLGTEASDPEGAYCVTSAVEQSCSSESRVSGEFFIGPPFAF